MKYELTNTYTIEEAKNYIESYRYMMFGYNEASTEGWTKEEIILHFTNIIGRNRENIEYKVKYNKENNTIEFYELTWK